MLCGTVKSMESVIKSQKDMHATDWIYQRRTKFENSVTTNQNARAIKTVKFNDLQARRNDNNYGKTNGFQ